MTRRLGMTTRFATTPWPLLRCSCPDSLFPIPYSRFPIPDSRLQRRLQAIPQPDLQPPPWRGAVGSAEVDVRRLVRRIDVAVVTAEIPRIEDVVQVGRQTHALRPAEREPFLQPQVHVLVGEHATDAEEGTGRRLIDVRHLLVLASTAREVRRRDRQA